jgi:hypothetical protein
MAETGNEPPPSGLTNKLATLFARAKRLGIWGLIASLIAAIAWNLAVDNGTKLAQREIDKRLEQKLSEKPTEIPQVAPSQAPQQLAVPTSSPPQNTQLAKSDPVPAQANPLAACPNPPTITLHRKLRPAQQSQPSSGPFAQLGKQFDSLFSLPAMAQDSKRD